MDNLFHYYLNSTISQILDQLNQNGVCQLIGIYGIGKGLVIEQLQSQLTSPSIRINLKDIRPESNQQIYQIIIDELYKHGLIEPSSTIPQTDFEAHYLLTKILKKTPFVLILQEAHQLLHFPDSFWDNLESLRYYQGLKIVISGQPKLIYSPTPGLNRLAKCTPLFIKLLTKSQITAYLQNQYQITDPAILSFVYHYSRGHIGTAKFLLSQFNKLKPKSLNRHTFEQFTNSHPLISVWLEQVLNSLSPQAQHIIMLSLTHNLTAKIRSTPDFKTLTNLQLMRHENFTFKDFANHILPLINSNTQTPKLCLLDNGVHYGTVDISLSLTKIQTQILKTMLGSSSGFISYDKIGDIVWGKQTTDNYSLQAINQHMSRLKKKLTLLGLSKHTIKSVRSKGYKIQLL